MKPLEAYDIIDHAFAELGVRRDADGLPIYNEKEIQALVMCFVALSYMNDNTKEKQHK